MVAGGTFADAVWTICAIGALSRTPAFSTRDTGRRLDFSC